ncbi:MAG: HIT domain-containing protein [Patescibacteria group bacterium]
MIKKAKFLAKEAVLRARYIMEKDCIFCKIIAGEIKSKPIYQSEFVLAIDDINPIANVHILIIPKRHIASVLTIEDADSKELVAMHKAAANLVKERKLEGFRLIFNGGRLQHVPHLHMHLLAGGKVEWEKL